MSEIIIPIITFVLGGALAWRLSDYLVIRRQKQSEAILSQIDEKPKGSYTWDVSELDDIR